MLSPKKLAHCARGGLSICSPAVYSQHFLCRERKLYIVYSVFIGRSCASEQGTNLCLERKHQSFLTVGNHPCYPATVICILRIVCCSGICDVFRPACFYDFPLLNLWHSCRLRIDEDKACKMLKLNFYLHMSQTHHKMKNHLSPSHIGTTLPSERVYQWQSIRLTCGS